jgi:hypothetical protein
MNRTRIADLLAACAVLAVFAYLLLRFSYDTIPALSAITPAPLAALGIGELVVARRVRRVVARDPDAKPLEAITIARLAALGKASALVGAGVSGAALGLVVHVLPDVGRVDVARTDAVIGVALIAAAAVLAVAGMVLERSGIAPTPKDRRHVR